MHEAMGIMRFVRIPGLCGAAMTLLSVASALVAEALPAGTARFFQETCVHCHGPEKQKADLRLDTLEWPASSEVAKETWRTVLEMLAAGEMPPEKEPRPDHKTLSHVRQQIEAMLSAAAGPAPSGLRRLNRYEYEHTVQDLLGIETPLAGLLPEDGQVQGFDNVSDGLSISAVLMERYLEAADTAFDGMIRRIPPLPAETRHVRMMDVEENIESVKKKKGGTIEVDESFVKFTPGWPPVRMDEVHPIEDGLYRCRLAVWPHQPSERTLSLAVYVGPLFGPGKRRFMGMYDVTGTPDEPRVIEFTTRMHENDAMHLVPWIYPEHVTWRDKHEPRPGIGVVWAETHGPLDQSWPAEPVRRVFGDETAVTMKPVQPVWMRHRKGVKRHELHSEAPEADLDIFLRKLIPRAFRRPVDSAVEDAIVELALNRLGEEGATFEQAARAGFAAVLCSPYFLLLNHEETVDDYTLASRLSYFLWSSRPDDTLTRLAAQGRLGDPTILHAQVDRMIDDGKSGRFVDHFTGQWLDLRDIEFTTPDTKLYPEFDELLQESMLRETRAFFAHILTNNLSVLNFVDSDFGFLNERLARHYGFETVKGHEHLQEVTWPADHVRGGVLTHGSVLKVTANGTTTSPVLRGVWLLDKIMGQPPAPPPPGVPAVEPDIRGAVSIRDQLKKHREIESCARCHRRIDPPGFALECFDPIGGYRERYRSLGEGEKVDRKNYRLGPEVDSHGVLPDGHAFEDFPGFRRWLAGRKETIAEAMAAKLLVYGTGRPLRAEDHPFVREVADRAAAENWGLRAMIHAVVDSDLFHRP